MLKTILPFVVALNCTRVCYSIMSYRTALYYLHCSNMEALKQLFKLKAEFVRSQTDSGSPPTDEQLASFLSNLTAETGLAIRGTPRKVK